MWLVSRTNNKTDSLLVRARLSEKVKKVMTVWVRGCYWQSRLRLNLTGTWLRRNSHTKRRQCLV
ncbi:hypothetical protein Plhal304r1_c010g0041021 [Plasmopara halstedii]